MIRSSFHIFHHQRSPDEKIGYSVVPFGVAGKYSHTALFVSWTGFVSGKSCEECIYIILNVNPDIPGSQTDLAYISRQIKKIFPIFCFLLLLLVNDLYHDHITPSGMSISYGKCRF